MEGLKFACDDAVAIGEALAKLGYEVKVDVDAVQGVIEEANIELYEIGAEKE